MLDADIAIIGAGPVGHPTGYFARKTRQASHANRAMENDL